MDADKRSHKKRPRTEVPDEDDLTPPPEVKPEEVPLSGTRSRKQVSFYGNPTSTVQALKRGGPSQATTPASGSKITRSGSRGNLQELATPTRPSGRSTRASAPVQPSPPKSSTPLPRGTRVSRRNRSIDDEWQQIPAEWLDNASPAPKANAKINGKSKGKGKDKGNETANGDESDLSDLTDEEEHAAVLSKAGVATVQPDVGRGKRRKTAKGQARGKRSEPVEEKVVKAPEAQEATTATPPAKADALDELQAVGKEVANGTGLLSPEAMAAAKSTSEDVEMSMEPVDEPSASTSARTAVAEKPEKQATPDAVTATSTVPATASETAAVAPEATDVNAPSSPTPTDVAEPVNLHAAVSSSSAADAKVDPAVPSEDVEMNGPEHENVPGEAGEQADPVAKAEDPDVAAAAVEENAAVNADAAQEEVVAKEETKVEMPEEDEYDENDEVQMAVKEDNNPPEGFVEWEAVCLCFKPANE